MYLIIIEAESDADRSAYHNQPYRLASSFKEAKEMMRDYMRIGPDGGALVPTLFALYEEHNGEYGQPMYFDPASTALEVASADFVQEFLAATGRI